MLILLNLGPRSVILEETDSILYHASRVEFTKK